jgi:hypothetical protein
MKNINKEIKDNYALLLHFMSVVIEKSFRFNGFFFFFFIPFIK